MTRKLHRQSISGAVFITAMLLLAGCGQQAAQPTSPDSSTTGSNTTNQTQAATNQTSTNNQTQTSQNNTSQAGSKDAGTTNKQFSSPPSMQIDKNKNYQATLYTTDGPITIQLFAKDSPITVNNFIFLAKQHFYDNVKFHRIIKDFMVQTGDPTGTGMGGPGYTIQDELPPRVPYTQGIVAMANTGQPNSGGSQFFICTADDSTLPPQYTVFGKVTSGMDNLLKIANTPVKASSTGELSAPTEDVRINSITVQETPGG